jgi:hypothetical protein
VVLKLAGSDPPRDNTMKAATHMPNTTTRDMVLPGIEVSTSPADYQAMKGMRIVQFNVTPYKILP